MLADALAYAFWLWTLFVFWHVAGALRAEVRRARRLRALYAWRCRGGNWR